MVSVKSPPTYELAMRWKNITVTYFYMYLGRISVSGGLFFIPHFHDFKDDIGINVNILVAAKFRFPSHTPCITSYANNLKFFSIVLVLF